ncbi:MAG: hypothetical protein IPM33_04915 [Phycisphaerales bacterium]|nr:hypothetical protein [Phycisphaerales bacterium]
MTSRRGYAMAIALMIGVVVIVLFGVLLQRQGSHALMGQRILGSYSDHHLSRGYADAISAWVASNASRDISEALGPDGHAFDLTTDSGQAVRVWMRPGQGTLLVELGGLASTAADDMRRAAAYLRRHAGNDLNRMVRREGPLTVDVRIAPEPVLRAVLDSVLEGDGTDQVLADLISRRRGPMEAATLTEVWTAANLDNAIQRRLSALFVVTSSVWEFGVQAMGPAGLPRGEDVTAYGGLVHQQGASAASRADRAALVQRSSRILEWWKAGPDIRWWEANNR